VQPSLFAQNQIAKQWRSVHISKVDFFKIPKRAENSQLAETNECTNQYK
jgi:hypothetical protein